MTKVHMSDGDSGSRTGRLRSEAITIAKARGSKVTVDLRFMKDVEEGIAAHNQTWNPPSWNEQD